MMTTLLEIREFFKRFYAKYDIYVKAAAKFFLALLSFLLISSKVGFMQQLRSPLISVALAALCAVLPMNGMVIIGGLLIIVHAVALSLEVCLVTVTLFLVMYLLYFRISSKMGMLLMITPLCFMLDIPYVVPLLGGLLFGLGAAVPAACGSVIYYLLNYMHLNSTSLGTGKVEASATKVVSLLDGVLANREMFLCAAAMVVTVIVVHLIRKLSVDHAWELAIAIGTVVNIVIHLTGAFLPNVTTKIGALLIGSVVSALIAFAVKFFVFSVDYTRTERVQFEDDEYYYYVKAVPKNVIAEPKKTVKKIVTRKSNSKNAKRNDEPKES